MEFFTPWVDWLKLSERLGLWAWRKQIELTVLRGLRTLPRCNPLIACETQPCGYCQNRHAALVAYRQARKATRAALVALQRQAFRHYITGHTITPARRRELLPPRAIRLKD